jgi:arsenate reductase
MSPNDASSQHSPILRASLPPTAKTRVLFLCVHNSARSQMAEAFLRHYAGDRFEAFSAGLQPDAVINSYARKVMEEIGISLTGQYPKHIREYMGRVYFGHCFVVCSITEERCPTTFPCIGERLYWPFEDPADVVGGEVEKLTSFREVRDQIEDRVRRWLRGPARQATERSSWSTGS